MRVPSFILSFLICGSAGLVRGQSQQSGTPPAPPVDLSAAVAAGPTGSLAIRGVQGTAGGPEVGADEVEVVLFHQNQPVHQLKTVLDGHGVVVVRDLPVAMAVRPVVRIKHAGVLYQEVGPTMAADRANAAMEVTVYETSEETPAWRIVMRHVEAQRAPIGLIVSEMLMVDNPADRTWLGAAPDAQSRRTTVSVRLPSGAADLQLASGFHGWCCTAYAEDVLRIQMPLMPGRMTYKFVYRVPEPGGKADLRIAAPVATDQVVFMLPPEAKFGEPSLVEPVPGGEAAGGAMYQARAVSAGTPVGIVLTAATPVAAAKPEAAEARGRSAHLKIVGGAGAAAAAVAGLVMFARRRMSVRS